MVFVTFIKFVLDLINPKRIIKDHYWVIMSVCLGLEGIKFALETFIDNKDISNIFAGFNGGFRADVDFKPGFYDVDIDEFPSLCSPGYSIPEESYCFY